MINRGATVRLHAIRGTKLLIEGGSSPLRNVVECGTEIWRSARRYAFRIQVF